MSRSPRTKPELQVIETARRSPHVDLLEIDEKVLAESLASRGLPSDGELTERVDVLQDALAIEVPAGRMMKCCKCSAVVDREDDCPFCGGGRKKTLFTATDLGNAERLVHVHGAALRYCAALGGWLAWDGKRWARDELGKVEQLAKRTIRNLYAELAHLGDDDHDELLEHVRRSESARGIAAMVRLAQTEPEVGVAADAFDRDPMVLNCSNGTLDLRTLELRPHDPGDLLTKITGAPYEPAASSPMFEGALSEWLGDPEIVDFVRRALGYSITGLTSEEKLFFAHGPAAGGKSTLVESARAALGDYARTADFEAFLKKQSSGGARNDIARLQGARFVSSIEVEEGKSLAEALVKTLTGGDVVVARFLYREGVEFKPQLKLWLVANDAPRVSDRDSGMWRRILRIPFERPVPPERRNPKLKATLTDASVSGPAVLAWLVRGCAEWQRLGLKVPASITQATEEYRESQDPLREFFEDCVVFDSDASVSREDIRRKYETWCKSRGVRETYFLSPKAFAERLRARGLVEGKSHGTRTWRGARLAPDHDDAFGTWNTRVNAGGTWGQQGAAPGAPDSSEKRLSGHVGHDPDLTSLDHARSQKFGELGAPSAPSLEIPQDRGAPARAPTCPQVPPDKPRLRGRSQARVPADLAGAEPKGVAGPASPSQPSDPGRGQS